MKKFLALLALLALSSPAVAAITGTFTVAPTTGIFPYSATITWNTTGATACSGAGSWTGTKALSGTQTVTVNANGSYTLNCTAPGVPGTATLSWTAPTQNTNGTTLTDLAGFEVHYGTASGAYTSILQVPGATSLTAVVSSLTNATWFFSVKSYNTPGIRSDFSGEVSKVVASAPETFTRSVSVTGNTKPNPPVLNSVTISALEIRYGKTGPWVARAVGTAPIGTKCVEPVVLDRPQSTGGDFYRPAKLTDVKLSVGAASIKGVVVLQCVASVAVS